MNNGFAIQSINIQLDDSVKSLTKIAAMCISGVLENGIFISRNENPDIKIFKNKIEFGKNCNPELYGVSGNIFPNFFLEFGNLVYYFNDSYKVSLWNKQLDYKGMFAPSTPDNPQLFNMIYPRFA